MNFCENLFIIGGKAGAMICYDLVADSAFTTYFLEFFCKKEDIQARNNVIFLEGKIEDHVEKIENYFVATGDNLMREKITNKIIKNTGKYPVNLIHPTAWVSKTAKLGYGNLVLPRAVIHTNARIGNGCIINTNSTIEHDNYLGDYTQIAPGVTLCGYVKIGDYCFVSANATVISDKNIANKTVVGAGAVVTTDIVEEDCLFAGVPAILKKRYHESKHI